jgi:hypothetical protein
VRIGAKSIDGPSVGHRPSEQHRSGERRLVDDPGFGLVDRQSRGGEDGADPFEPSGGIGRVGGAYDEVVHPAQVLASICCERLVGCGQDRVREHCRGLGADRQAPYPLVCEQPEEPFDPVYRMRFAPDPGQGLSDGPGACAGEALLYVCDD